MLSSIVYLTSSLGGRRLGGLLIAAVLAGCGGGDGGVVAAPPALAALEIDRATAAVVSTAASVDVSRKFALEAGDDLTEAEALAYIASHPDLIAAFGTNTTQHGARGLRGVRSVAGRPSGAVRGTRQRDTRRRTSSPPG